MIKLLLPALVTPTSSASTSSSRFLEVSGSSSYTSSRPPAADAHHTRPPPPSLAEFFKDNPHEFCQGFLDPNSPIRGKPILRFKKRRRRRNDDSVERQLLKAAVEKCNNARRVRETLTQNSAPYYLSKKRYFIRWYICLFKKLGKNLACFKFSFKNCVKKREKFLPQLRCNKIRDKFKKAKNDLRGNNIKDVLANPNCPRNSNRSGAARRLRRLREDDDHGAGIDNKEEQEEEEEEEEEEQEGRRNLRRRKKSKASRRNRKRWNLPGVKKFSQSFFKNPSQFCRDYFTAYARNALSPDGGGNHNHMRGRDPTQILMSSDNENAADKSENRIGVGSRSNHKRVWSRKRVELPNMELELEIYMGKSGKI